VLDLANPGLGWQSIRPLPQNRGGGYATVVNGQIYILSGFGVDGAIAPRNTVLVYDPVGDTYTPKPTLMTAGTWMSGYATTSNGKIYVIAGLTRIGSSNTAIPTTQIYDVATDTWTTGPTTPQSFQYPQAAAIGTDVYLIGGYYVSGNQAYLSGGTLKLSDGGNTWQNINGATLKTLVYRGAAGALDGKIYIAGGFDNTNTAVNTTQVFDPTSNTWQNYFALPAPKAQTQTLAADATSLYLAGGDGAQVYKLTPGAPKAVAQVEPESFVAVAKVGQSATREITVSNGGVIPLTGTITAAPGSEWISTSMPTFSINPGESEAIAITVDAGSLAAGEHIGTFNINTNDEDNPTKSVSVRLYVVESLVEQETKVVMEEATGSWCGPCGASGTPMMRALKAQYGDRLIQIALHDRGGRGATADLMATAQTEALNSRFSVQYFPSSSIQRWDFAPDAGISETTDGWESGIEAVLNATAHARVAIEVLEYRYDASTKRVTAKIKLTTADAIPMPAGTTLRMTGVVIENNLQYPQAGSSESPYFHQHVARSFWPNIDGQSLAFLGGAV
jgi:hypothetical protein